MYTLIASTVQDQYRVITQSSFAYQIPDFTYTEYTPTYTLLEGASDATALYSSWLSITRDVSGDWLIDISAFTSSDVGEYNLIIFCELDDTSNYPAQATNA